MNDWSIPRARDNYNLAHWSNGYVDIADNGHLLVRPDPRRPAAIDLTALTTTLSTHELTLPVLVRFPGILRHRLDELHDAFIRACQTHDYRGRYTAVYPIKVNQQKSVVRALVNHGGDRLGLEAGSKPELLAVLAQVRSGGVVVCNGYKDREYVRLALIGKAMGHQVHIVVEKLSELELVLAQSKALGIKPLLGVRVRLASIGAGKWQNTGGEKAKFGLSAADVLRVVERLRDAKALDALAMLHFHMGSQIANIQHIQHGMREAARFYAELRKLGAEVRCINVGGGLGIDYEGTRSRSFCSMNYSVQEYADNIVRALAEICDSQRLPPPDIISESGRALTAHHAVLITNVIDTEMAPGVGTPPAPGPGDPQILHELWERLNSLSERSVLETYHDAVHGVGEAQTMFSHGVIDIAQRARVETFYFHICRAVRERLQPGTRAHREILDELNEKLADKYFVNFSLFQSIPDHWAIEQIFPVMPLSRLHEPPTRRAVLEDITCDSDGRVDLYVDSEGVEKSLPLHAPRAGEPYLLGIFLVGAYQEILGDMHNLFGDTDSVNVELDDAGGVQLDQPRRGDTVGSVLRYVSFDADELLAVYREKMDRADWLTPEAGKQYLSELAEGLQGYTYLEE